MPDIANSPTLPAPSLPKYPKSVFAAGLIWVAVGANALVNLLLILRMHSSLLSELGTTTSEAIFIGPVVGRVMGSAFGCIVGCFFIYEGVECIRGTTPSTLGLAVGSILLAGIAPLLLFPDLPRGENAVLLALTPAGLFLAGVLALIGRGRYHEWQREERRRSGQGRTA